MGEPWTPEPHKAHAAASTHGSSSSRMGSKRHKKKRKKSAFCSLVSMSLSCFQSTLCCLCISFNGVFDILAQDNTREFALAVIIGEAFNQLIVVLVESTVTPLLQTLFSNPADWQMAFISGGVVLTTERVNGSVVEYKSVEEAALSGVKVFDFQSLMNAIFTFTFSMLAVYWLFCILKRVIEIKERAASHVHKIQDAAQKKLREELDALAHPEEDDNTESSPRLSQHDAISSREAGLQLNVSGMEAIVSSEQLKRAVLLVDCCASEEEAMRKLYESDMTVFYMYGEHLRRMLRSRLIMHGQLEDPKRRHEEERQVAQPAPGPFFRMPWSNPAEEKPHTPPILPPPGSSERSSSSFIDT